MSKKRTKYEDVVSVVDGVKYTMCAPRLPRNAEKTFSIERSRYTQWAQGVSNMARGTRGCTGTVNKIGE